MGITHAKVSAEPDDPDTSLVRPSDWNADHVVPAGAFTDTHIAAANKDGATGTPSMRTLGTGAQQAAAGDHAHAGVYQPVDADLTAVAGLSSNGLVERTGAGTAAIRALGVAASTDVPTRADADTRYAAASHAHTAGDVSGLAAIATSGSASDLNAGTVPAARMPALTGDVTTSSGAVATTIANNAVTDAKLRDSAALSVIGRSANSSGDPADITAGSDGDVLRRSGTAIGFGAIPESSVTNLVADLAALTAAIAALTANVTTVDTTLTNAGRYMPDYLEIGNGLFFALDTGGILEIG